jgi:hypothetical protein
MAALVLLTACVTVDYPRPGQPIEARAGEALVFGRVRVLDDSREYFPWRAASVLGPELHLWFLRLEPRGVSTELQFEPDGSFRGWLEAGDYALVANRHEVTAKETSDAERQDMRVVALLRVPSDAVAAYAGVLVLLVQAGAVDLQQLQTDYEFGGSRVTAEPLSVAQASLEQTFGPLPRSPVQSPWCAGDAIPGFHDVDLATRGRRLLDNGCATSH